MRAQLAVSVSFALLAGCFASDDPIATDSADTGTPSVDSGDTAVIDPNEALKQQLAASEASWATARDAHGDDYAWTSRQSSYSGLVGTTTIEVVDGVVVARGYVEECPYTGCPDTSWSESAGDLGTHDGALDAPAYTLDQVYAACLSEVLSLDPEAFDLTLTFTDDDLLASCSAAPVGCMDDCASGYWVTTSTWADAG